MVSLIFNLADHQHLLLAHQHLFLVNQHLRLTLLLVDLQNQLANQAVSIRPIKISLIYHCARFLNWVLLTKRIFDFSITDWIAIRCGTYQLEKSLKRQSEKLRWQLSMNSKFLILFVFKVIDFFDISPCHSLILDINDTCWVDVFNKKGEGWNSCVWFC